MTLKRELRSKYGFLFAEQGLSFALCQNSSAKLWPQTPAAKALFSSFNLNDEKSGLMLSSVLNSERAIEVNIQIMRTFTKLRQLTLKHIDLRTKIEEVEKNYNSQFKIVFKAIKGLLDPSQATKGLVGSTT